MREWLRRWVGVDDMEDAVRECAHLEVDVISKRLTEMASREHAQGIRLESLEKEIAALKLAQVRSTQAGPKVARNVQQFKAMLESEGPTLNANR